MPDFIMLSEIWINSDESESYKIDGYNSFFGCNDCERAGGVAIFSRDDIRAEAVVYNLKASDCLGLNFKYGESNFYCLCVYRYHRFSVDQFMSEFRLVLESYNSSRNFIILGDFNIDILSIENSSYKYLLMMSSFGLKSLINTPTRSVNNSSTCIDHAFVRSCSSVSTSKVGSLTITDHAPIFLKVSLNVEFRSQKFSKGSVIWETIIDYDKLNSILESNAWDMVLLARSADNALKYFLEMFHKSVNGSECLVFKKIRNTKLKPWISDSLCSLIKYKNFLGKKVKKHSNNVKLLARFKKIKRQAHEKVESEKNAYYLRRLNSAGINMKKQWSVINSILGSNKNQLIVKEIKDENGSIITDSCDIGNVFNCHFVSVANTNIHLNGNPPSHSIQNSFVFDKINDYDVMLSIHSLKNKNSMGTDRLTPYLVKQTAGNIVHLLEHVFNTSVNTGLFPEVLKTACVLPLFKGGSKLEPTNYRPISLLPVLSKIFEKIVKKRLMSYLDKIEFLSDAQFGFRIKRSTEDALFSFTTKIYQSLNQNKVTGTLFLDISKAFDTVSHDILLNKLWNIGIRGFVYCWMESFIKNRNQMVKIGNICSSSLKILAGVPQGSVLGPLLFLIYINSIFDLNFNGEVVGFADDLTLSYSTNSCEELESQMNHDLQLLQVWFSSHKMSLSTKTKGMIFNIGGHLSHTVNVKYHLKSCASNRCSCDGFKIEFVNEYKYLGLCFDNKLSFRSHINKLKPHLYGLLRKLFLLRNCCPRPVLEKVYYGLFNSKFAYGLLIYGGAYYANIEPLIIAQKFAVRILHNKKRLTSSLPLFRFSGILPLRYLYIYKVLKMFFSRSGHRALKNTSYDLRDKQHCMVPFTRREFFKRFYTSTAPNFYNRLPALLKSESSLHNFLKNLKRWLFTRDNVEGFFEINY